MEALAASVAAYLARSLTNAATAPTQQSDVERAKAPGVASVRGAVPPVARPPHRSPAAKALPTKAPHASLFLLKAPKS